MSIQLCFRGGESSYLDGFIFSLKETIDNLKMEREWKITILIILTTSKFKTK